MNDSEIIFLKEEDGLVFITDTLEELTEGIQSYITPPEKRFKLEEVLRLISLKEYEIVHKIEKTTKSGERAMVFILRVEKDSEANIFAVARVTVKSKENRFLNLLELTQFDTTHILNGKEMAQEEFVNAFSLLLGLMVKVNQECTEQKDMAFLLMSNCSVKFVVFKALGLEKEMPAMVFPLTLGKLSQQTLRNV